MSDSSSSDEEDEHLQKLRESIDTGLINDSMFKEPSAKTKDPKPTEPVKTLKSERYLDLNDGHENSMYVTESMQNLFYKKLSQVIENSIVFVDPEDGDVTCLKKKKSKKYGVKLLRGFDEYLKDAVDDPAELNTPVVQQKKPKIKRKLVQGELDVDESTKIEESIVRDDEIQSNFETGHWTPLPGRDKVLHYREKNSTLYLQEPENEFTQRRKKNNWDECKISRKYKKKSIEISKI